MIEIIDEISEESVGEERVEVAGSMATEGWVLKAWQGKENPVLG